MIRALIFDLDDTLYPEQDFVKSGYRAVASYASQFCPHNSAEIFSAMMAAFRSQGRAAVMPLVAGRFLGNAVPIERLVDIYRSHDPEIDMLSGYPALLRSLAQRYRLGIITDGSPEVQRRKVAALHFGSVIDEIIFTWDYGREKEKPHPFSFQLMLDRLDARPEEALFIGDNPEKDGIGAVNAGMRFIHLRIDDPSLAAVPPDIPAPACRRIAGLEQLDLLLQDLN